MARGRLRCLGTSLRLKARFGSGYRVSIRVQGSSGSGDSATADADSGSAAGAMAGGIPSAGARLGLEDCEIQPAPLAVQPGLHPAAPPQRSGSNHSGRSVSGEPAEQAQQRDPVAARQAGGVKALFLRQLGIKPGEFRWVQSLRGPWQCDADCVQAQLRALSQSQPQAAASFQRRSFMWMRAQTRPAYLASCTTATSFNPQNFNCCVPVAVDESLDYVHFLVPYEHEDRLPALFAHIKVRRQPVCRWLPPPNCIFRQGCCTFMHMPCSLPVTAAWCAPLVPFSNLPGKSLSTQQPCHGRLKRQRLLSSAPLLAGAPGCTGRGRCAAAADAA